MSSRQAVTRCATCAGDQPCPVVPGESCAADAADEVSGRRSPASVAGPAEPPPGPIAARLPAADSMRGGALRRRALLFAVAAQLADAVTFVAAIRAGVPVVGEANPLARAVYPVSGSAGVVDLKLIGVAVLVMVLALGERWRPHASGAQRFILAGTAIIGLAGLVGAIANMTAALSVG